MEKPITLPWPCRRPRPGFAPALGLALLLGACAGPAPTHEPPFVAENWAGFSRASAIAIAEREWRLFGSPVDDNPPAAHAAPEAGAKPERAPGLWQRVGEYWWLGLDGAPPEGRWTGIHDETGLLYDPQRDGDYAWSAAFISYVMRMSGAGASFPYSASHATYINVAAGGGNPSLSALDPASYAPAPGDLLCLARGTGGPQTVRDLPWPAVFPAHCDIVTRRAPGTLLVIGGNVDDAVTAKHVPLAPDGKLVSASGRILDPRYPWLAVLAVHYAE